MHGRSVDEAILLKQSAAGLQRSLIVSHPNIWFGLMLIALHMALAWGIDGLFTEAMLMAHFGLFLLWQPIWQGDGRLENRHALGVILVGLVLTVWCSWWLMAVWLALLFGLIGGKLIGNEQPRQRFAAMLGAFYLLSFLLVWVVPHLFVGQLFADVLVSLVRYGLLLPPLVLMCVPEPTSKRSSPLTVDLFYSVLLFLLVAGLVLGSFVVKEVSLDDYPMALAQSLIIMAFLLMLMSWLWNPHAGFMGIGRLMSRYLMSIGLPFERWVRALADLAEREREPARFMSLAAQDMCSLPWISGVKWNTPQGGGETGHPSSAQAECSFQDVHCIFYARSSLSPAMWLHLKLLTQMVGHFYHAKLREEMQRQNAYTQAIHETGARLTHDVKNILQSLRSLCAAVEGASVQEATAAQDLVRRQLPQIAQRLTTTLEKLQAPGQVINTQVDAASWWAGLRQRYTRSQIDFSVCGEMAGMMLPRELFDSVVENLLQNAIAKVQQDTSVRIKVTFDAANSGVLMISDSGEAVPESIAARLLNAPVPSQSGLGIGLFHAARQAAQLDYRLELAENREGCVCFRLSTNARATATSAP
jgi:signal transduction histidine kinase